MLNGFGGAPIDEVDLARRVAPDVERLHGNVPDARRLSEVMGSEGIDFATMLFYQAIHASPLHGEFVRLIDGLPASAATGPVAGKLLIVPAMFYRERPALGGEGRLVAEVARSCGLEAEILPVSSRGSVTENQRFVWEALVRETRDDLWLFSLSKGGAEVRLALESHAGHAALRKIRGWINVSGLVRGTHYIDSMLGSAPGRLRARAFCLALGMSYEGVKELRTTHRYWRDPPEPPAGMTVINLVGVPLLCHIQEGLVARYRRLSRFGPNDGFVLLPESIVLPGLIYPIWGSDHLFRSPQVSPLLYRVFRYVRAVGVAGAHVGERERTDVFSQMRR
jgi:hypothetical protein